MPETTTTPKLKSVGAPQSASFAEIAEGISQQDATETTPTNTETAGAAQAAATTTKRPDGEVGKDKTPNGEPAKNGAAEGLSTDQIKAFFQSQGIEWDGNVEGLKQKLAPPKAQPTDEEKQKLAAQRENRIVNYFTGDLGRKVDEYTNTKLVANAQPLDVAKAQYERELKAQGYTEDQVGEMLKEQFFQYTDAEIEAMDDADDKETFKKKRALGTKQLEAYAAPTINSAKQVLKELDDAISAQDFLRETQDKFSSKVDDYLKGFSKKITVELGETNGQKLDPVEYEFDQSVVTEVTETLKNPEKRQQLFFNPDHSFNLETLTPILLKARAFDSIAKTALLEGQTRQVKHFESVFPQRSAHDVGLGDRTHITPPKNGERPRMKSVGKPVLVKNEGS